MKKILLLLLSSLVGVIIAYGSAGVSSKDYDEVVVRTDNRYPEMETKLQAYIADKKDAHIGIAVIVNGRDTVEVNGRRDFPMLSVYKFPQARAVADYCVCNGIAVSDTIAVKAGDLKENTWSPMRDRYGIRDVRLPLSEILEYSLSQSDNNACDILFGIIGGPAVADSLMKTLGYGDIVIASTEDEMHQDLNLCYRNTSTPVKMAALFDRFYRQEMYRDSPLHETIASIMLTCKTGLNRLPAPLTACNNIRLGHKTGTGDKNAQDRIIAVNDAGYVFLSDTFGYSIAVFISDSAYDMEQTERIIGDISGIVFATLVEKATS